jgi:peptidoglycan hydrolase-like protein with peptidoglycan-binding domain
MNARYRILIALAATTLAAGGVCAAEPAINDAQTQASARTGAQLYASPSQIRLVQEKLREQGRKPGSDGVWDEATVAEVRDYQKANGLAPTGQLDTSLLSALEIGDVLEGETSSRFLDGLLRADRTSDDEPASRGAPLYVSPVHIAQIQHLLRELGHYEGQIDGAWGGETAQAANKFREQKGLEASDALDLALLRALNQVRSDVPKLASAATGRSEGVALQAGPAAIRALQRELGARGHEAGAIDGVWGENTRQALREFQREHDLESTGTLTLPTLAVLGVPVSPQAGASQSSTPGAQSQDSFEALSRDAPRQSEEDEDEDAVATAEPQDQSAEDR